MTYIKHKNMRDVCAEVIEVSSHKTSAELNRFSINWINLLGTFEHPAPFPLQAFETIIISREDFKNNWRAFSDLRSA